MALNMNVNTFWQIFSIFQNKMKKTFIKFKLMIEVQLHLDTNQCMLSRVVLRWNILQKHIDLAIL